MATERRPNADDSPRTEPYADSTSNPHEIHPMPSLATPLPPARRVEQTTFLHSERLAGLVAAAALAASIALIFTGCSTPVSKPSVDVPANFAAGTATGIEPEAAWWESFHDPVLTRLVQLAAQENRDIKVAAERLRAARSGVTVSRSFLSPSVSAVGSASDRSSGYGDAVKQAMPDARNGSACFTASP